MTDEDTKIEEALGKCTDVHLSADFADRLVKRIRESGECEEKRTSLKSVFTRVALVAASLTLLLGFVPGVFDRAPDDRTQGIARCDGIRAAIPTLPQDSQLDTLALLGFCREVIRRRMRSILVRGRKRKEEE